MEKRREAKINNELRVNSNLYTNIVKSGSKYVEREKVFLWFSEIGIKTRLRSEHVKLNLYNKVIYGIVMVIVIIVENNKSWKQ